MNNTVSNGLNKKIPLTLAALGVVYGDIGTSPLYAMRESLEGVLLTTQNVFGVLSLIFWSLFLTISMKYMFLILKADNNGEGGILALLALIKGKKSKYYQYFLILGMVGAGLLLGDGMLTPAISVVSAIAGLRVIAPGVSILVIPLTICILIGLFLFQSKGTSHIGKYFGPIVLVWFIVIGFFGAIRLFQNPAVLAAINPYYAFHFIVENGFHGYWLLGSIFLVVTGGEALYADLGHFGKTPIKVAWFCIVLPSLLLNYFGQGSYLLLHPETIANPFYAMAPYGFSYFLLFLATCTAMIASQAIISAIFSVSRQGVLLQFMPRLTIIQTTKDQHGQVFLPEINFLLALGSICLVLLFKKSSALAHAYGFTINLEMLIVTIMVLHIAVTHWQWSLTKSILIFGIFILIDLLFLGATFHKILYGGWIPLSIALIAAFIMYTCYQGIKYVCSTNFMTKHDFINTTLNLNASPINPTQITSIFITDQYDEAGGKIINYFKLNGSRPKITLIVNIIVKTVPYVSTINRCDLHSVGDDIYKLNLNYGFMELIDLPKTLSKINQLKIFPFILDLDNVTYFIEMTLVVATRRKKTLFTFWQEKLFALIARNAEHDLEFYRLPYHKTIAIGTYCEI